MISVLVLIAADSASAAIQCGFDPTTRTFSVSATEEGSLTGTEAELRRVGEGIVVSDKESGHRVICQGSPTVTNTDLIKLRPKGFLTGTFVSLIGGPFAPGASPEPDASSEIEFTVTGRGSAGVSGGP